MPSTATSELHQRASATAAALTEHCARWVVDEANLTRKELPQVVLALAVLAPRYAVEVDFEALLQPVVDASRHFVGGQTLATSLGYGLVLQRTFEVLGLELDVLSDRDRDLATVTLEDDATFDLLGGVTGQLWYLALRPPTERNTETRNRMLDWLERKAVRSAAGTHWRHHAREKIDLNVAHGAAGVAEVIALLAEKGMARPADLELLRSTVAWLLGEKDPSLAPYCLPAYLGDRFTRLAWCVGELGVSSAMIRAARVLDRHDWVEAAKTIALNAARISLAQSHVRDASVCHGAAGVSVVFAQLAKRLNEHVELSRCADLWLQRALELRQPAGPSAGYPYWSDAFVDDMSLLQGVPGIALALASGARDFEWPSDLPM